MLHDLNLAKAAAAGQAGEDAAITTVSQAFAGADLFARMRTIRNSVPGRIVFTTSFGIEDQALTHAILTQDIDIDILTLDTGRLFPETYAVWSQTERRYARRIAAVYPEREALEGLIARQGIDGFRGSVPARQSCCHVRKVAPLRRALFGVTGWVTGLRAGQSAGRAQTPPAEHDAAFGVLKINPLFDWTRDAVAAFADHHRFPVNALHERGFPSIGCAPCTRAIEPGEHERAGRWWWEQEDKKECGLHQHPASRGARLATTDASR